MQPLPLDPDQPRRDFLKKLSAASIAALMARAPRASAETIVQPTAGGPLFPTAIAVQWYFYGLTGYLQKCTKHDLEIPINR